MGQVVCRDETAQVSLFPSFPFFLLPFTQLSRFRLIHTAVNQLTSHKDPPEPR